MNNNLKVRFRKSGLKVGFIILVSLYNPIFNQPIQAQLNDIVVGADAHALSNTFLTRTSVWNVFHNQAGLGFAEHLEVGFFHENRFNVSEFTLLAFGAIIPTKTGNFGLSHSYYGYRTYHETTTGISYGKLLAEKFTAGVKINYINTYFPESFEQYKGKFIAEVGVIYAITNKIKIASHIANPNRVALNKELNENIPSIFRFGGSYSTNDFNLAAEFHNTIDEDEYFSFAAEYFIIENLPVRVGFTTGLIPYSFGIGYSFKNFTLDISNTHHEYLGNTPQFSIVYKFLHATQ